MKKLLFGIFAHPDDEAFGPSAYLYRQASSGVDVHLIVATDGDAGINNGFPDLAKQRSEELRASAERIGAASCAELHYQDGSLCNALYLPIAQDVISRIENVLEEYDQPVSVSFLTYESGGVTGHIDHIAISFITTYVFETLRRQQMEAVEFDKLLYYCVPKEVLCECNVDWLYMPSGRPASEIALVHPHEDLLDQKLHIIRSHQSQQHDIDRWLVRLEAAPPETKHLYMTDHFIVYP